MGIVIVPLAAALGAAIVTWVITFSFLSPKLEAGRKAESELARTRKAHSKMSAEVRTICERIEAIRNEHHEQLIEVETNYQSKVQELDELRMEYDALQVELNGLKTSTKTVIAANTEPLKKELAAQRQTNTQLLTKATDTEKQIETLQEQVKVWEAKAVTLSKQYEIAKNAEHKLREELNISQRKVEDLQSELVEAEAHAAKVKAIREMLGDILGE